MLTNTWWTWIGFFAGLGVGCLMGMSFAVVVLDSNNKSLIKRLAIVACIVSLFCFGGYWGWIGGAEAQIKAFGYKEVSR